MSIWAESSTLGGIAVCRKDVMRADLLTQPAEDVANLSVCLGFLPVGPNDVVGQGGLFFGRLLGRYHLPRARFAQPAGHEPVELRLVRARGHDDAVEIAAVAAFVKQRDFDDRECVARLLERAETHLDGAV